MQRGFTLAEVLVVIAIIAILAGLAFPALSAARRSAARGAAKAVIERLRLACESYKADFGDYPPTTLAELGIAGGNGTNEGIECLVRCLTTRLGQGGKPYLEPDERDLANTDGDRLAGADPTKSAIESKELFELADPWGNPYIYFHNRDYRGGAQVERYALGDGRRVSCRPRPSEKTGQYPSLTSFMIWSAGPDGVNENGEGDDVCSWK